MDVMTTAVEPAPAPGAAASTAAAAALPVYAAKEVPAGLRTMTQLKADRLKPAPSQEPVAFLVMYRRGHGWGRFPLYDPAGAAPMRPLSAKQQAAKDARRTCPECQTVREYIVYQRCQDCREKAQAAERDLRARTCDQCRRVSRAPLVKTSWGWPTCDPCRILWAIRRQAETERRAAFDRTCHGRSCTTVLWTDDQIAAAKADGTWSTRTTMCPPCQEAFEVAREQQRLQDIENDRLAREARAQEVRDMVAWAAAVIEDDQVVVLDTETTGLEDDAAIVDIAVTDRHGQPILDTLIDPQRPIPWDATGIHGIADSMVSGAPTFGQILERLTAALAGRRCLIYNAPYDKGRLRYELTRHHRAAGHPNPEQAAADWMTAHTFEDAMIPYSTWYGDWSDYWGNYSWQPLHGGDHRALGDCRAVILCLTAMAQGKDEQEDGDPWETSAAVSLPGGEIGG